MSFTTDHTSRPREDKRHIIPGPVADIKRSVTYIFAMPERCERAYEREIRALYELLNIERDSRRDA